MVAVMALAGLLQALGSRVINFRVVSGYMLTEGSVNGIAGFFLIDTGTPFLFFINNHYVPLPGKRVLQQGQAASGETFTMCLADSLDVEVNGLGSFANQKNVVNAGFKFLEDAVCGQFLGFLGYKAFEDNVFSIDYDAGRITIYDKGENPMVDLQHYTQVATIRFTVNDAAPQLPLTDCKIGEYPLQAFFDTGTMGQLKLTAALKERLIAEGLLMLEGRMGTVRALDLAGAKPKPLGEQDCTDDSTDQIGLGYAFLSQYLTVWNYREKTIELWQR